MSEYLLSSSELISLGLAWCVTEQPSVMKANVQSGYDVPTFGLFVTHLLMRAALYLHPGGMVLMV